MLIAHGSFHILMSHGFHCSRQTRWLAPKPHSTLLLMVDRTDWQGRSVFASLAVNRDFELPAVRLRARCKLGFDLNTQVHH
jgi:hypothetical protein